MFNIKSIKFDKYKSFENNNLITNLKNVNVFIGKNNCGKSSCLDVVEFIVNKNIHWTYGPQNIFICQTINEGSIKFAFPENRYYGIAIVDNCAFNYGIQFNQKDLWYSLVRQKASSTQANLLSYNHDLNNFFKGEERKNDWNKVAKFLNNELDGIHIFKISAERNIYPECDINGTVNSTGEGITSKITSYLTDSLKDEKIIEEKLLLELNKILAPDSEYSNIKVQQIKENEEYKWEIFLTENGNRFALSKMGSGLKTIIFVLLNLIVLKQEVNDNCIFLFEELENNLHPSLQRRLFNYIYDCAEKENLTVFITTHSHVAINVFFGKENSSIYHIEKNDCISTIHEVSSYFDKAAILDDLDVKASDLFQSNGIIWVEGPSDRVYIKKWLEIKDPNIIENIHYQFAYYGGKNLSHYTTDEETNNLINILLTNRNSAIVIDSDKRSRTEQINATKKRILKEFEEKKLFCWITQGKEIENYIQAEDINTIYGCDKPDINSYELFPEYINDVEPSFTNKKVEFAKKITSVMNLESLNVYNLDGMITKLVNNIKKWNNIK